MSLRFAFAAASLGVAILTTAGPAAAHHSFAMFDQDKSVVLKGAVKELQWTNPHVFVEILARDPAGAVAHWSVEASSVSNMARLGWSRSVVKPGDEIEITIHPLKRGERGGSLVQVKLANGVVLGPRTDGGDKAKP
jgi:hypothetical protein